MSGPASDRTASGLPQPPGLGASSTNTTQGGGGMDGTGGATSLFPIPPPLMSSSSLQPPVSGLAGIMPDPRLWGTMAPQMAAAAAAAAAASGNPTAMAAFGALMAHHQQQQQQQQQQQHLLPPTSQAAAAHAAAAAAAAMMPPPSNFNPYQMQLAQMLLARGLNPFAAMSMLSNSSGGGGMPGGGGTGLFGGAQMPGVMGGSSGLPFGGGGAGGMLPLPPPPNANMMPTQFQPPLPLPSATTSTSHVNLSTPTITSGGISNSGINSLAPSNNSGFPLPPSPLRHPGLGQQQQPMLPPSSQFPGGNSQIGGSPSFNDFNSMAAAMAAAAAANNLNPFRMPNISAAAANAAMVMAANNNAAAAANNIPPALRDNFSMFLNNRFSNPSLLQQQQQQQMHPNGLPLLPSPFGAGPASTASSFSGGVGPLGGPGNMLPGGLVHGANPFMMFQDAAAAMAAANAAAKPKKSGKGWNAMHIRIAWEILSHQQKTLVSANQAAVSTSAPGLSPNVAAMSMLIAQQRNALLGGSPSAPPPIVTTGSATTTIKLTPVPSKGDDWRRNSARSPTPSISSAGAPQLSSMASMLAGTNNNKGTANNPRKQPGDSSTSDNAKKEVPEEFSAGPNNSRASSSSHLSSLLKSIKTQPIVDTVTGIPNKISSGGPNESSSSADKPQSSLNYMANFLQHSSDQHRTNQPQTGAAELLPLDGISPARPSTNITDLTVTTASAPGLPSTSPFYMQTSAWFKMLQDTMTGGQPNASNANDKPNLLSLASAAAALATGGDVLIPPAPAPAANGGSTSSAAAVAALSTAASQLMAHFAAGGGAPVAPHLLGSASSSSSASTIQSATPPPDITFSHNNLLRSRAITPMNAVPTRSGATSPETSTSTVSVRATPKSRRNGASAASRRKKSAKNDVSVDLEKPVSEVESANRSDSANAANVNTSNSSSSSSSATSSSRRRVSKRQRELRLETADDAPSNSRTNNNLSKNKRRRNVSVSSEASSPAPGRMEADDAGNTGSQHEINQKTSRSHPRKLEASTKAHSNEVDDLDKVRSALEIRDEHPAVSGIDPKRRVNENHSSPSSSTASSASSSKNLRLSSTNNNGHHSDGADKANHRSVPPESRGGRETSRDDSPVNIVDVDDI